MKNKIKFLTLINDGNTGLNAGILDKNGARLNGES